MTKSFSITSGDIKSAISIMKEAALWIESKSQALWDTADLKENILLKDLTADNFYVGYLEDEPIVTMILKFYDPEFWDTICPNESGFIHKLSITREYAGKGYVAKMIEHAQMICVQKGITYLRLDCDANRPKLCRVYEKLGFKKVGRKVINNYDTAFYELSLI